MADAHDQVLAVTITEVARLLGISRSHAYEMAALGELPALRLGRRILVPRAALERLLECRPMEPSSAPVNGWRRNPVGTLPVDGPTVETTIRRRPSIVER